MSATLRSAKTSERVSTSSSVEEMGVDAWSRQKILAIAVPVDGFSSYRDWSNSADGSAPRTDFDSFCFFVLAAGDDLDAPCFFHNDGPSVSSSNSRSVVASISRDEHFPVSLEALSGNFGMCITSPSMMMLLRDE